MRILRKAPVCLFVNYFAFFFVAIAGAVAQFFAFTANVIFDFACYFNTERNNLNSLFRQPFKRISQFKCMDIIPLKPHNRIVNELSAHQAASSHINSLKPRQFYLFQYYCVRVRHKSFTFGSVKLVIYSRNPFPPFKYSNFLSLLILFSCKRKEFGVPFVKDLLEIDQLFNENRKNNSSPIHT